MIGQRAGMTDVPGSSVQGELEADTVLTIELLAHMDAGDRRVWTGNQDERPLSELGQQQAALMAEALAVAPFDALYSSPAVRCRQTLEPLAERLRLRSRLRADGRLPIMVLPELRETHDFLPPAGWRPWPTGAAADPLGGAYAAGRALAALGQIRAASRHGRVAVCSHGDIVPALVAFLAGAHGLTLPPPHGRRGGWFTLRFNSEHVSVQEHEVIADFPGC